MLVAIVKKRLNLPLTLHENLQIPRLTLFEQLPLDQRLARAVADQNPDDAPYQLNLLE